MFLHASDERVGEPGENSEQDNTAQRRATCQLGRRARPAVTGQGHPCWRGSFRFGRRTFPQPLEWKSSCVGCINKRQATQQDKPASEMHGPLAVVQYAAQWHGTWWGWAAIVVQRGLDSSCSFTHLVPNYEPRGASSAILFLNQRNRANRYSRGQVRCQQSHCH